MEYHTNVLVAINLLHLLALKKPAMPTARLVEDHNLRLD
jgi:hypothetical protein